MSHRLLRHIVSSSAVHCRKPLWSTQWKRTVSTVNATDPNAQTDNDEYLRLIFDDKYVWKQHCANSAHSQAVGLLGNPNFANVAGFEYAAKQAIQRAQIIVERIWRAPENGPEEMRRVVKNLDRLSDTLCSVIDMAEFIRNAHPGPEVMEAANKAYMDLCYYMNILNTDTRMHKVLSQVLADPSIVKNFTPDEHAAAIVFLRDFEKSGIHLPDKQRKKFVELSDEIIQLGRQFTQCDFHEISSIRVPVDELRGVDPSIVRSYMLPDQKIVDIPTNSYACQMLLKCAESSETRRAAYEALNSANDESVQLLESLLHTRGELAKLVGKSSFAELQLQDKMAKNPENVDAFLKTLLKHQAPIFKRDMQILQQAMGNNGPIHVWDKEHLMRSVILSYNRSLKAASALPYFSIGSVMQGLSRLFKHLYGVQLVPATMSQGESWHPDVRKLDVVCEREGKIGTIYCDLFSRPGKTSNAAHYTVRTSRRVDDDDADNDIRYAFPHQSVSQDNFFPPLAQADSIIPGRKGRFQLPVIALTCDFNALPHHQATAMLSMSDVETLFHEMGHAMHSMLGQTDFHNVAGTRCATDFVELPSVLMEHFAWHPSVLKLIDAKLPANAVQNYLDQRCRFSGIELNSQILMALLDQAYHSREALSPRFSSRQVWQDLQDNYGMFPGNPKTMWPVQFGHLFGYGAGYYSYLFDRTLARRIWEKCFEKDPLDREQGQKFRDSLLKWGGARDPWISVASVLGDADGEAVAHGDAKAMRTVGDWGIDV